MTPVSPKEILERVLAYLKRDEAIDMGYLNLELVNLSDCVEKIGVRELDLNEVGALLHGIIIIEAKLKKLGLVSHLLKSMKDTIYEKSI